MKIQLEKIRYKNFLSVGNEFIEINLQKSTSTIILGKNGNGKSILLDALNYALYGKPFRKINLPTLINSITRKNMLVELEFTIKNKKYMVRRGMWPTVFEIYCNDFIINQEAANRDYQKVFEKTIFPITEAAFRQIVILGKAEFKSFFELPVGSRREIIESMLDIRIFSTMNSLLKEKVNTNKVDIKDSTKSIDDLQGRLDLVKKHLESIQTRNEDLIGVYRDNIAKNEKEVLDLQNETDTLNSELEIKNEQIVDSDEAHEKKVKASDIGKTYASALKQLKKEITFFQENDTCPTCQQSISEDFKEHALDCRKEKSKDILDKNKKLGQAVERIESRLEEIREISSEVQKMNAHVSHNNRQIRSLQEDITRLETSISLVENSTRTEENKEDVKKLTHHLKLAAKKKESLLRDQQVHGLANVLLKDDGIKAKVIAQYVPIINKIMNKYLSDLDLFVDFHLDENFNESFKSRGRDNFTYHSFSMGQRARIDIALLFTWREISKLRNSVSTNLLILDETFDGSLDAEGVSGLTQIIESMKESNVFIISHKNEMFDKFHSSISIGMEKGFTKILRNGEE